MSKLYQDAQFRWLKPAEVHYILQNYENDQLKNETPQLPPSGSLFLFNKRVLRLFRRDGHNWRKKKDQRTVGEAHERLKVGNVEALNCYYAHGEDNPYFQRRIYWILDPALEHIVLVHYRDITKGKLASGSNPLLSPESSLTIGPGFYGGRNQQNASLSNTHNNPSPGSADVAPRSQSDVFDHWNGINKVEFGSSFDAEVDETFETIETDQSLNNDIIKELEPILGSELSGRHNYEGKVPTQSQHQTILHCSEDYEYCKKHCEDDGLCDSPWHQMPDASEESHLRSPSQDKDTSFWSEILDSSEALSSAGGNQPMEGSEGYWSFFREMHKGVPSLPSFMESKVTKFDESVLHHGDVGLTVAENHKFTILEVIPDWGYKGESTKVIIVGSFLCDPSISTWKCMFGGTEVPVDIIKEGVIRCKAPPHLSGKVSLCITSGNRESCSEVRDFEFRVKATMSSVDVQSTEATRSPEELLLLVRFAQMLLHGSSGKNENNTEPDSFLFRNLTEENDSWNCIIGDLLMGCGSSLEITNWLIEELLNDKLQTWITMRWKGPDQASCFLSRKEHSIIHMVAGLGFEWALTPVLRMGVNINFRDINGWTALHWAAKHGREKMVAVLIASGAFTWAVTDPTSEDPTGKTPASIASINGHIGLAAYLSESALTSHLSSLTLEESHLSKRSAEIEADRTISSLTEGVISTSEDRSSLKDTLAAVRTAAQAAARIQLAFRVHSFRKRQQKLATDGVHGIADMHKLYDTSSHNSAALSIQKKYRGWKGRKNYLSLHKKVVKIQAHVRGFQARKYYRVFCWAVRILDRVVLRWWRKGVGLRSFHPEKESNGDSEDEDIIKVYRKEKVETAIQDAVSRVLSIVSSPEARQQYSRMLEKFRQAKAVLGSTSSEAAT
ncbi:hypothetical protein MLD38_025452 [Melastoma candidum]|uniref:Uncharacterized protein n=1 Tax=Melastoma candidum TaxID=119954 RepID=A0ACB9NWT7_9MYRT|nr:hypothetical protein MLD38_025452 [Melastoma candidum]